MDYNRKIHDLLYVDEQILTYKIAAAALNININEAKDVLKNFVSIVDKNTVKAVTYLVGGITSSGSHKVTLVSDKKYEKVKNSFKSISIDHIYSIQAIPLTSWYLLMISDDFLRDNNTVLATEIKKEPDVSVEEELPLDFQISKNDTKGKGSISSFFMRHSAVIRNANKLKTEQDKSKSPLENQANSQDNKASIKKLENPVISQNNKSPLKNLERQANSEKDKLSIKECVVRLEKISTKIEKDDCEKGITRSRRKRVRILSDDEEENISKKCQKIDILGDDSEESTSDIFGSPEKDQELNNDDVEENAPTDVTEKESKTSCSSEKERQPSTVSDNMYEDNDGYIVTEKKPKSNRSNIEKPPSQTKNIKVKATEDKSMEKETTKGITTRRKRNNTNQKTLFNFFNKK